MQRAGWYLVVGRWNGAPVRVHLLTPLLAVFFPFRAWSLGVTVGLIVVVLAHELGHAILVRRLGGVVRRIDLLPYGGECGYSGIAPGLHESVVAWGGVLAQGVLFAIAELQLFAGAGPQTDFARDLLWALARDRLPSRAKGAAELNGGIDSALPVQVSDPWCMHVHPATAHDSSPGGGHA